MNQVAEFEIVECFTIERIGLVIAGNVVSGEIKPTDLITFKHGKEYTLEISEVNYVDKRSSGTALIGLGFVYESIAEKDLFRNIKVSQQVAVIANKE